MILMKRTALTLTLVLIGLLASVLLLTSPVKAQEPLNLTIKPDGSVEPSTNLLERNGSTYSFKGDIFGTITVQTGYITIDGANYTLDGNGNAGIDLTNGVFGNPSNPTIYNITITNLIINGTVVTDGGGNDTFYNDYIRGISLMGAGYNNITYCTVNAIAMNYGADFNTITENNLNGALAYLSSNETVDRNYWSDYLTKYPNATEIDDTGIGNTPYVYSIVETRTPIIYRDNHPLMNPVAIPLMGSNPLGTSSTVPEFPSWIILLFLTVMVTFVGLLVYFKKRKLELSPK